ncbi:MAG: ABC transporter permease [Gemmatimonadota bacterium]|nr:ABC transporter permease [Gemmatimonadota bacterium]MDQ8166602.1 ABC transporter permease [Gemmatimonadota bacterium]MDQ8172281.1 ABC transporter permease [Gemmatimonadota bacterium]
MNRLLLVLEGVSMALDSIRSNKVRAGLTIAGVAIGVFVVVAMGAVVTGIRASFQKDLEEIGATTFIVQRRNPGFNSCDGTDEKCPDRRNPQVSLAEWEMIKRIPGVAAVIGLSGGQGNFAYRDSRIDNVGYDAYSVEWPEVDASDISPGRNFTRTEYDAGQPVVLINDTLKTQLFGESEPIGKQIMISGRQFTVIGIYTPRAGFLKSLSGKGPDNPRAIIPMQAAIRQLDLSRNGLSLMVRPEQTAAQGEVMDEVLAAMRARRGLRPGERNDFYLVEQDRIMETFDQLFGAIFAVGLALSAVALLVGGVGVVAIMMISVTERTREIGVRKALGATAGTIRWQFLVEAATLTSIGALIGLAIGALLAWVIRSNSAIPASLPAGIVATALIASAVTGVAFGMIPALRASKLDPVEALRHE